MICKVRKAPPYVRLFNSKCHAWTKDPEVNKWFLLHQQDYVNEILRARGQLFLNEVLDILGLPRTKLGQVVGWIYDPDNPMGDNFVDFGFFEKGRSSADELTTVLNFNVDGNIWDRL